MTPEPQPALDGKRKAVRIIVLLCAAISLGLMLWVGRHNHSALLVLMFAVWVASPFVGLIWLHRLAIHWELRRQKATYAQVTFISLVTVAVYAAVAFLMHLAKPAAPFLAVPGISWVLVAGVLWTGKIKGTVAK